MDLPKGYGFAFDNLLNQPFLAARREFLPGFKSTHHMHDFPQIWYCYKGHYSHQVNGQVYECEEGSVILLPMGTAHQFWCDSKTELLYINIHYNRLAYAKPGIHNNAAANLFLPAFYEDLNLSFSTYQVLSPQSRLVFERVFSWFAATNYAHLTPEQETEIGNQLETFFSTPEYAIACKNWKKAWHIIDSRVDPILKIVAYLNNFYPERITDETLQRVGNINRTAMYRYFKQLLNNTYSHFLQFLRIRHAHICLRDTTYSLQDIAERCGFYDRYHLSRVYSKCNGQTISNQRERIAECRRNTLYEE